MAPTVPADRVATPGVGLSVMPQPGFLAATLPLFEAGMVDVIEWSFDMSWQPGLPGWLADLIADYETAERMSGHGVSLSPLSTHPRQDLWFERFGQDVDNHQFSHVSEHFGFMAAGDFRLGPPLPLPMTNESLRVGIAHLRRLAAMTNGRVGLENLAFAFGSHDVWTQGDFLESLLAPVEGFLVLDVHNLWCQIVNFDLDAAALLASYPVDRVRECHMSGGSWSTLRVGEVERTIRRDTHDETVPDDVFALLDTVLGVCPNVETVILERIGDAFTTTEDGEAFRHDFHRVRDVVAKLTPAATQAAGVLPPSPVPPAAVATLTHDGSNYPAALTYPAALLSVLDEASSSDDAIAKLRRLDNRLDGPWSEWVSHMDHHMVATALELVATWGRRN